MPNRKETTINNYSFHFRFYCWISCKDNINDFDDIYLVNLFFIYNDKKQNVSTTFSVEETVELLLLRIKSVELSAHDIDLSFI